MSNRGSVDQKILTVVCGSPKGIMQSRVRMALNLTKQNADQHVKRLVNAGFIALRKEGKFNILSATRLGAERKKVRLDQVRGWSSTLLTSTRIHHFQLQFDCEYVNYGYLEKLVARKEASKGYLGATKKHKEPTSWFYSFRNEYLGVTLQFTNNKKLKVFFSAKVINPYLSEFSKFNHDLIIKLDEIKEWLRWKQIAYINMASIKDNYIEIANRTNEYMTAKIPKQHKVVEYLGYPAKGFFTERKEEAKAWIESSPEKGNPMPFAEIETNCTDFGRLILLMPRYVAAMAELMPRMSENTAAFAEQINLHLAVQRKTSDTLDKQNKVLSRHETAIEKQSRAIEKLVKVLEGLYGRR